MNSPLFLIFCPSAHVSSYSKLLKFRVLILTWRVEVQSDWKLVEASVYTGNYCLAFLTGLNTVEEAIIKEKTYFYNIGCNKRCVLWRNIFDNVNNQFPYISISTYSKIFATYSKKAMLELCSLQFFLEDVYINTLHGQKEIRFCHLTKICKGCLGLKRVQ